MALSSSSQAADMFLANVKAAIEHSIEDAVKGIIEKAKADVERAIRAELAHTVLKLSSAYEVDRTGENIRITVRLPNGKAG